MNPRWNKVAGSRAAREVRFVLSVGRSRGWGTMVLVDKAGLYGWFSTPEMSMLAVVVNAAIGVGLIRIFVRYLKDLDELQRKIQLDSLALAMGVGLVTSFSYSLLVTTGHVVQADVSDVTLIVILTYMGATILGQVRYR
ncbi:MAG: hypothetical protein CME26_13040 [Gemmatimonadetes bacterium]|nr:hypothetical protein [Gemmatimonadota bacterium]